MKRKILLPVPTYGFDPTEAAIPWKILTSGGFDVHIATPGGKQARADEIMLTGEGLGLFKPLLMARRDAISAYAEMEGSSAFRKPISYAGINPDDYDGIFLPGGHHKGVREYLESEILQRIIPVFFKAEKPVGAVCHAPVLLSRSINPESGKTVLYGYRTTALLKSQERLAYHLTRRRMGDYYLTYPGTTVEDEVRKVLRSQRDFRKGPLPLFRDKPGGLFGGFVVRDRNYVSGRWPGDIYSLTRAFGGLFSTTV